MPCVDDMLIGGKKRSTLNALKDQLYPAFAMKDLGQAEHSSDMRTKKKKKQQLFYIYQEKHTKKRLIGSA